MGTPAHAFIAYTRALLVMVTCSITGGIIVSRVYIFYEAYAQFTLKRTDEAWLRSQCKEAEFYSNMRQHTDICAQVEQNAMQWVLLHSLNTVCTTAHMCGSRSCMEYVNDLVVRGIAWPVAAVVCLFVITIPSIITSMASRTMWRAFDSHARKTPPKTMLHHDKMIAAASPFYAQHRIGDDDEECGGVDEDDMMAVPLLTSSHHGTPYQRRRFC
jgi:hypothetical protein